MKKERSAAVGLVVGFVAMIAIVGAITYSNYEGKVEDQKAKAEDELQEKEENMQAEKEEESQSANMGDVQAEIEDYPEIIEPEINIIEESVQESPLAFSEEDVLSWPVDGNVLIPFNMEQTVYFATLDQYKYNPAVMIAGEVGEEVWAATDGKVTSIKQHAQTGITVTVDLGDGFEAIYGQLGELHVKEGDRINEGVLIGYLGEPTKYYSVEGCNLYFQLLKDGEAVDPLHYLDV